MGEVCKVAEELSDSGKLSTSFDEVIGDDRIITLKNRLEVMN
jgi:hypothetical protein